jgi:hypothetical protein
MQDQNHQNGGSQDPWASLAESLGVGSAGEPAPTPPAAPRPTSPARSERRPPRPAAAPPAPSWDSLASDLGLGSDASQTPVAPRPRPTETRPEGISERTERGARSDVDIHGDVGSRSDREERVGRADRADRTDRFERSDEPRGESDRGEARAVPRDGDSAGSEDGGRTRGRRRRGRRGGRGRRELETSGDARPESDLRADGGDRRDRDGHGRDLAADDAFDAGVRDHDAEPVADRSDALASEEGDRPAGSTESAEDGDRPRRRRRGRRGGRGRSRSDRDRIESTADRGSDRDTDRVRSERDRPSEAGTDDEPLPTSYGMRPAGPPRRANWRPRPAAFLSGRRRGRLRHPRSAAPSAAWI